MAELLNDEMRDLASVALLAYNAMETTKRRHFDYLTVKYFKTEAQLLQKASPEAHRSLFTYIGLLNEVFTDSASASDSSH